MPDWLGAYELWAVVTVSGYLSFRLAGTRDMLYWRTFVSLAYLALITIFAGTMTVGKAATTLGCLVALLGSVVWIVRHRLNRESGAVPKINLMSPSKK